MSYESAMFHRMAEEMERIAYTVVDETHEHMDEDDVFTVLNACSLVICAGDYHLDEVAEAALCVAAYHFGGMGEVLDELPDATDYLLDLLMRRKRLVPYRSADGNLIYAER